MSFLYAKKDATKTHKGFPTWITSKWITIERIRLKTYEQKP